MERYVAFENDKGSDAPWIIVDRYREEGKSAKDTDREEYQRMMSDIKSGRVNTVGGGPHLLDHFLVKLSSRILSRYTFRLPRSSRRRVGLHTCKGDATARRMGSPVC